MCRRTDLKKMCDSKVIVNGVRCKAAPYGGMQNGSHGEKEKSKESKSKNNMVETEREKLLESISTESNQDFKRRKWVT